MHEISGRHCAHLTKSLRWIGSEVSQIPIFNGFSQVKEFLTENEIQVPSSQKLQALDVALRATLQDGGLRTRKTLPHGKLVRDC